MPKYSTFSIDENPLHLKGRILKITKSYTDQNFIKKTVLTDDVFPYIAFYFSAHSKAMKYINQDNVAKFGNAKQFGYEFYWNQSEIFYKAAKKLPIEAAPVAAYYCMLNAAKSFLAYTCGSADEFVEEFGMHGLIEDNSDVGENLETISIAHRKKGVFPLFARKLDSDFSIIWESGKNNSKSLKCLLYNLPFVHRAYSMTYTTRNKKVDELFIPLNAGDAPKYYKGNDGKAYMIIDLEKSFFSANAQTVPMIYQTSVSDDFKVWEGFRLISKNGAKRNPDSISRDVRDLTKSLRKNFAYIRGTKRLWYLKRKKLPSSDVLNLNTMTINMAAMHRISEIARYKPEQLNRLMKSKENWLLHEFISQALDQFIDELASEITKQDIMCVGQKG